VRLLLSAASIMLGVAFVVGTLIFTDTLNTTFSELFGQTTSDVELTPRTEVSSQTAGAVPVIPASLLPTVSAVSGVRAASGTVLVDGVTLVGPDGKSVGSAGPPQYGANWDSDPTLTPFRLVSGHGPQTAGQIAIDSVSASKSGYQVGDSVPVVTPVGLRHETLVGIFRFGSTGNLAGATITAFDTRSAQQLLLHGKDAFTSINVAAADGVSQSELAARIKAVVPASITVQTGQQAADKAAADINKALQFVNIFLLVFAGIALFVGTFIIVNTFSMLVGQRTRELALLRAVGATRRQVTLSVLAEAGVVALVGSLVGIAVGVGVAIALQGLFKAVGVDIPTGGLTIEGRTVLTGLVLGLVVTLLSALGPALRASRVPPVAALRDDVSLPQRTLRLRGVIGVIALLVGLLLMVFGIAKGSGQGAAFVGLATVITLVAVIVLSPLIAGPVIPVIGWLYPRMFGTVGRLALDNAHRQPRRTAATASALMIGLALVSALTIFATSTSASVADAINNVIGADFLIQNSAQRPFPPAVATAAARVPGVAQVSSVQQLPATINGSATSLTAIDPATIAPMISLTFVDGSFTSLQPGTLALDSVSASDQKIVVGDHVVVRLPTTKQTMTVSAIYDATGGFQGYVTNSDSLRSAGVNVGDTIVYIKADAGADLSTVQQQLDDALAGYPTVDVQNHTQLKQSVQGNVNQLLAIMVLLLSLAIIIAVLGIVNTLVLSVIERTREIGLLRAVGALRKQVRRIVVLESVVIALFGALLGLVLGIGFAIALQRTLVTQGITILAIPWVVMVVFVVLAAIVGALAALWPAFRAGRLDVLRAVTTE